MSTSSQHVMIDIETMGAGNYAAIIAIGAAKFHPHTFTIMDSFYTRVSLASSLTAGMRVDASTIEWWMAPKQAPARDKLMAEEAVDLRDALNGLAEWFGTESKPVWGNGATFDNVILRNAYQLINEECPWSFRDDRCYRTIKALAPQTQSNRALGTQHHALADCEYQIDVLQQIVAALNLRFD